MMESALLRDWESRFNMGRRHTSMIIRHINTKAQSPIMLNFDLTMRSPYQMPRSPNFLAMVFAATRNSTHTTDWKRPIAAVKENWNDLIPTR